MAEAALRWEVVAGDRSLQAGEMAASVASASSAREEPAPRRLRDGPLAGAPKQ